MINELIKQVNLLKYEITYKSYGHYEDGYNKAIGDVTQILIESKPKVLDKPKEPGFWWLEREFFILGIVKISLDCVYVDNTIDRDGRLTFFDTNIVGNRVIELVDNVKGRWQKAIMPEWAKKGDNDNE